jgi:DNA polymerase III alpha subunit
MKLYDLSVDHPSHSFVHASGAIVHNCAFLICNEPVSNFIPQTSVSGVTVTQYTAPSAEEAGALKYDFLVINSLKDMSDSIKLVQEKHGFVPDKTYTLNGKSVPGFRIIPHNGHLYDIWDLPEDQDVFNDICEGSTETVFQFNTPAAKQWLKRFNQKKMGSENKLLDSIEALSAFTALDRPGPLDAMMEDETGDVHNMLVEYARRATLGVGNYRSDFPILDQLLPETYGIIVYQEQLTRIFREIGKTTGIEAENFRGHISKKQMAKVSEDRELFMKGAVETLGQAGAEQLWGSMFTFGQYGFNKSHAISYVTISYACAFLKHHYPLEWWTAVLRNADKNEISEKFWGYCGHLINLPDIKLSGENFKVVNDRIQAPISLLQGIGATAHAELVEVSEGADNLEKLFQNIYARRVGKGKDGKLARSALHRSVMYTLIVSGTMDSMFPIGSTMLDKLMAYETARAVYEEMCKKKPEDDGAKKRKSKPRKPKVAEPVLPAFVNLNAMQIYQLRKSILPAYSGDVYQMICDSGIVNKVGMGYVFPFGDRMIKVVQPKTLDNFNDLQKWPSGKQVVLGLPCFIQTDERRVFGPQKKDMAKLTLESGGSLYQYVKWPDRGEVRLKDEFQKDLTGTIGIAILSKYCLEKPFTVEGVITVQAPFEKPKEESHE